MSYDGKERRGGLDCCADINGRVSSLEANQNNLSETLKEVVKDLKSIVLELAQKRAVEKFIYGVSAAVFTIVGWGIEHLSHVAK